MAPEPEPEVNIESQTEMPEPMAPEPEPEVNIESQTEMPEPMAPEPEPEVNIESQTEKQQDAGADADADGEEKSSGSEVLSHSGGDKDKCWSPLWNKHVHHGQMGAKKCCWYGDWTHKSKCDDGHDDDKDKKYVVKSDQNFPPSAKTTFKSRKSFFDAC